PFSRGRSDRTTTIRQESDARNWRDQPIDRMRGNCPSISYVVVMACQQSSKGYFDRVWLPGVAFDIVERRTRPLLQNITRFVVVTTYGSRGRLQGPRSTFLGDMLQTLRPLLHCLECQAFEPSP